MPSFATFNANNFFLRYRFQDTYPGDQSKKSKLEADEVTRQGFLPGPSFQRYSAKNFIVWDPVRRELAARALRHPDDQYPDILCLQEVENIQAIRILNDRYFKDFYGYSLLIDGYDPRNIDVAILSRYPIRDVKSHIDEGWPGGRLFSRDCLEATFDLPGGEKLSFLVNHLKSKFVEAKSGETKGQALKKAHELRRAQAAMVLRYVEERFAGEHDTALYAVLGDFNDTPLSPYLKPLVGSGRLTNILNEHLPHDDRWTYYWRAKGQVTQIDYVLGSKALAKRIEKRAAAGLPPHIERRGLAFREKSKKDGKPLPEEVTLVELDDDGVTPIPEGSPAPKKVPFQINRFKEILGDVSTNISDHCPVKIWF